jgi:hypothetical protein
VPYSPNTHTAQHCNVWLASRLLSYHSLPHLPYSPTHCLIAPHTILPLTASSPQLLPYHLIYYLALSRGSDGPKATLQYERDLGPGEYFGEAVLSGVRTRSITVIAMTACDLVSFEDDDFLAAQVREREREETEGGLLKLS